MKRNKEKVKKIKDKLKKRKRKDNNKEKKKKKKNAKEARKKKENLLAVVRLPTDSLTIFPHFFLFSSDFLPDSLRIKTKNKREGKQQRWENKEEKYGE